MKSAGKTYEPITYADADPRARDAAWARWRGLLGRL